MAEKYIADLVAAKLGTEVFEYLNRVADFHKRRLWHQLTLELASFVKLPVALQIDLVELYKKFISTFEAKLNQLSFVRIIADISVQLQGEERINFVTTISELPKVVQSQEAFIDSRSVLAQILLTSGDKAGTKATLQKAQSALDTTAGLDATVYSNFYRAWANYHKAMGDAQSFYNSAIQYIAYTQIDALPKAELGALAFDLGLAALLGEEIFNFGDLLEHPVLDSLNGTEHQWLSDVINAFNNGDINLWQKLQNDFAPQLNQQEAVRAKHVLLEQKIRVMSLVEMLWKRPSDQRSVPLGEVAAVTQLPVDEVEMLIMRTLSLGLIRGSIDEVDQILSVTWVQPHILNMEQIGNMSARLGGWTERVKTALRVVESGLPQELGAGL